MARWTPFPYAEATYRYSPAQLANLWPRLHAGDAQPWPEQPALQAAWAHYHAGDFQSAVDAGLTLNGAGQTVANKAQLAYARFLETAEATRVMLRQEVLMRTASQLAQNPNDAAAHALRAQALAASGQGIGVARAMALGLGLQVRLALEAALALQALHAEAHAALGSFHADTIDSQGTLLGRLQGADGRSALHHFRLSLKLNPHSPGTRLEYARCLRILDGEARAQEADRLYAEAAACEAADAVERMEVEQARVELED
jgi:hypothetical protein